MDEKNHTAETNDEIVEQDIDIVEAGDDADPDQEEQSTQESEDESGEGFSDTGDDGDDDGEAADPEPEKEEKKPEKPKQTSEENAEFARIRREREKAKAIEDAKKSAYEEGLVAAVKGVNPYTHEPIKDAHDVKEYMQMLEIDKAGGDPVAEFATFQKKKAREAEQKAAEQSAAESSDTWIANDRKAFSEAHPDIDVGKLLSDKKFIKFADGKAGTKPMTQIYADYLDFVGEFEKTAETKAQRLFAKKQASPGPLGGAETKVVTYENMSDEEFEKAIQKAKRGELRK